MLDLVFDLNNKIDKQFDITGYGFFIKRVPAGLKGFIVVDDDPATVRDISYSRVIRFDKPFRRFKFVTHNTVNESEFLLTVAETEADFANFPTNDNSDISGDLTQTNILLDSIDNKIIKADTDNVKLAEDNIGLAKETTQGAVKTAVESLDSKIIKADTDNVQISADNVGLAKETTQGAIKTAVESLDSKTIKADTDNVQRFIDNAVKKGQAFFWMKNYSGDLDLILENPTGSGKSLFVYNFAINNTGTSNITIDLYKNSTTDASDVGFIPNKKIDSGNSRTFTLKENGTITNGTLLGSFELQGNNFFKQNYDSFSILEIPEGKSLHLKISTSSSYSIIIDIIEI